jgi:hypothetical protein
LYDAYVAIYGVPAGARNVDFTVAGNIGSASTGTAALDTGSWPAGSTIKLIVPATSGGTANSPANGVVAGAGGNGGGYPVRTGTNGGPAINLNYNLTINNSGIIGGGGGGGGSSGWKTADSCWSGGGGGGAGVGSGVGGGPGPGCSTTVTSSQPGTTTAGGARGSNYIFVEFGNSVTMYGGNGGALGVAGNSGSESDPAGRTDPYAGGAAGKCINLNGRVATVNNIGAGVTYGTIS